MSEPPDGAYTNAGADLSKLLGRVYTKPTALMIADTTRAAPGDSEYWREDYNGYLQSRSDRWRRRWQVTVEVEIVDSEQGSGKYMVINDDGEEEEVDTRTNSTRATVRQVPISYLPIRRLRPSLMAS